MTMDYKLLIYSNANDINPIDDNVDVEIKLDNGETYVATFFTLENIKKIFNRYEITGECANGLYLWSENMIIIENLSEEIVRKSIDDLIESGEVYTAFKKINT